VVKGVNFCYGFPRFTGHTFIELTQSGLQANRKLGLICQTLYMDRIGLRYIRSLSGTLLYVLLFFENIPYFFFFFFDKRCIR
jgi:hypothetical protein